MKGRIWSSAFCTSLNRLWLPSLLLVSSTSFMSGCAKRATPAPVIELYQGKSILDFEKDGFSGQSYTVQKGDTLYAIAWYSGNDYRDIARINKLTKPYPIYPGQKLFLNSPVQKSNNQKSAASGLTSKINTNQTVDRPEKQAYGESKKGVNKLDNRLKSDEFPSRVAQWIWPANGKLISNFSLSGQGNKGIEISGQRGNNILAAADGKVVYTGNALRGYGQLIIIKHSDSFLSAYAHNNAVLVKEQQWIKAGQKIASMGSTGTDQIKLRFEVRYRGKSVDPLKYLPAKQ